MLGRFCSIWTLSHITLSLQYYDHSQSWESVNADNFLFAKITLLIEVTAYQLLYVRRA